MTTMVISLPSYKIGTLDSYNQSVSESTLPSLEDLRDVIIATDVKTVYLAKGKAAFTPLREYQKRRRGKKV